MRIILIIGALLLGLVGLFMSVCGGGFLIRMTYGAVTNIVHSGHWQEWPGVLILLALPAAFATGGAVCAGFLPDICANRFALTTVTTDNAS
jgi:hypothetical protein